jgi:hypothetical protein
LPDDRAVFFLFLHETASRSQRWSHPYSFITAYGSSPEPKGISTMMPVTFDSVSALPGGLENQLLLLNAAPFTSVSSEPVSSGK